MSKRPHGRTGKDYIIYKSDVESRTGCWIWNGSKNSSGYGRSGRLSWTSERQGHRIAFLAWHGEIPDGHVVMHRCDVRDCVNPDHLTTGTNADNIQDCIAKGRYRDPASCERGEKRHTAKLTTGDVLCMRFFHRLKIQTIREAAEMFGVSYGTAWKVVNRKSWKHLP